MYRKPRQDPIDLRQEAEAIYSAFELSLCRDVVFEASVVSCMLVHVTIRCVSCRSLLRPVEGNAVSPGQDSDRLDNFHSRAPLGLFAHLHFALCPKIAKIAESERRRGGLLGWGGVGWGCGVTFWARWWRFRRTHTHVVATGITW